MATMRHTLSGDWQFRKRGETTWYPARVPGCVHSDLLANHLIEDPMYRRNEREQFWIAEFDWEYRKRFPTPKDAESGCRLVFEGLDTAAEITLNGKRLAKTCNMHRRYAFDVTGRLRPIAGEVRAAGPNRQRRSLTLPSPGGRGDAKADAVGSNDNELVILFRSPMATARKLRRMDPRIPPHPFDRMWPYVEHRNTCRNFIRKAQYQFGWDWGMAQATSGIWRDAYLETGGVYPNHLTASQTHRSKSVDLDVTLFFTATKTGRGKCAAAVIPSPSGGGSGRGRTRRRSRPLTQASKRIRWKPGENHVSLKLTVESPKLWWPNGLGNQPLYELAVTLLDENDAPIFTRSRRIGFRTIELACEPDEIGESFGFIVNGLPVYVKGANWVPVNTLPSSATDAQYCFLLESCVRASMNCLRVWGGGIYEPDLFYDRCDELGLMVWQDHLFACSAYPSVKPFADEVEAEIVDNVRRLQTHPSLALWCGDNENEFAIQIWWRDEKEVDHIRKSYHELMEGVVRRVTEREDPSRPFRLSSPTSGPGRRETPNSLDFGDAHVWDAWFGNAPFAKYLSMKPRFASEFGFLSFAHGHTFERVTEPGDRNPASPVMEHHQRMVDGNPRIIERLLHHFRLPSDFDALCYVTQLVQALGMRTIIEHWRRIKPRCGGTLYWQLNETWPEACNSSIDGAFQWKAMHYAARRFYAPVLASFHPVKPDDPLSKVEIWITSDEPQPVKGRWTVDVVRLDGKRRRIASKPFSLKANESRRFATLNPRRFLGGTKPDECVLRVTMKAGKHSGENVHFFGQPKYLELPKARLKWKVRRADGGASIPACPGKRRQECLRHRSIEVEVKTDVPAFYVELFSRNVPGTFIDNVVHLLDGRPRTFAFTPRFDAKGLTLKRFSDGLRVRSLAETY